MGLFLNRHGKYQSKNMVNMQIHFTIIKDNTNIDTIICTKLRMFTKIHKLKGVGMLY